MLDPVMFPERGRRSWPDWFGCFFFIAFAVFLLRSAPSLGLLMLPSILHDLLTAASFLLRGAPKARLTGIGPRMAAYGGTFILPVFMLAAAAYRPGWLRLSPSTALLGLGLLTWVAGIPLILLGIWNLRRSFSLEPQARKLVASGPYLFARHPIYTGYLLQYFGLWLAHLNPVLGTAVFVWLALMMARIRYEEAVLTAAFPEYNRYKHEVGMFGPKLFATLRVDSYVRWKKGQVRNSTASETPGDRAIAADEFGIQTPVGGANRAA